MTTIQMSVEEFISKFDNSTVNDFRIIFDGYIIVDSKDNINLYKFSENDMKFLNENFIFKNKIKVLY